MPLPRRAALGALAILAGCRSPEPALYTIVAVPGAPRRGGPSTVSLREVSLAQYLDRQSIVRAATDYRLDVSSNDWWGEPLASMLTRVLAENLGQRLPGSSVVQSGGAITVPAQATVEVNLQRMGLTAPDALTLVAQVAVNSRESRRATAARAVTLTVPVNGAGTQPYVAAASVAVGRLADAIAALLTGGQAQRA